MNEPSKTDKRVVQDKFASRMPQAITASIVVNILFWSGAIVFLKTRPVLQRGPIIAHLVMEKKRPLPKVVPKKPLPTKIAQVPKTPPKPLPEPEGAHNKIVTRKSPAKNGLKAAAVLAGGKLRQGVVTAQQTAGNNSKPPDGPTQPAPPVAPPPIPPPVVPDKPAPPPVNPVAKPIPAALPDPKPRIIQARQPTIQAAELQKGTDTPPELPDELKQSASRTFVRVRFEIAADGASHVTIRTSSGNAELDRRVIAALLKWKWTPKMVDGEPMNSEQSYKLDFEVE